LLILFLCGWARSCGFTLPVPCPALAQQESRASGYSNILWLVITLMFLLQSLLIIGQQRSRLNNKRARKALKESQRELERKIAERTESLHQTNNRLQDEIARHEATVLLLRETQDYLHRHD
jgi:C4-dicarboxylate-specific signal transduction histidine kinase